MFLQQMILLGEEPLQRGEHPFLPHNQFFADARPALAAGGRFGEVSQ
jgi:hypothetical protein